MLSLMGLPDPTDDSPSERSSVLNATQAPELFMSGPRGPQRANVAGLDQNQWLS